ncbi:tail fiber assembly protein [Enterobacteriaceae bacterium RIT693]|nr:tail fiber assembly protein [Enterobacteriaceae bacterium RIT693]
MAKAQKTKSALLDEAADSISLLQDAADIEMATEEELQQLNVWKTYRIMLSRVGAAPDVKWPEKTSG